MNDKLPTTRDLQILIDKIEATDKNMAYRISASHDANEIITSILKPTVDNVTNVSREAVVVFNYLSDESKSLLISTNDNILSLLVELGMAGDSDYPTRVRNLRNTLKELYPPLIPLHSEIVSARYAKEIEQKAEAKEREANVMLAEALQKTDAATDTARGISLKDAQTIFKDAADIHSYRSLLWGFWGAISFAIFIGILVGFYEAEPPTEPGWGILYFTSLRLATLGAIGTVTALFVTQMKAHLHMREHNLHRMRIANSASALLAAVIEDAQKDQILAQLVDALTQFGQSGILGGKGDQGDIGGGLQRIIQISSPKGD